MKTVKISNISPFKKENFAHITFTGSNNNIFTSFRYNPPFIMGNFRMSRDKHIGENPTQTELIIFVFLTGILLRLLFIELLNNNPSRVSCKNKDMF